MHRLTAVVMVGLGLCGGCSCREEGMAPPRPEAEAAPEFNAQHGDAANSSSSSGRSKDASEPENGEPVAAKPGDAPAGGQPSAAASDPAEASPEGAVGHWQAADFASPYDLPLEIELTDVPEVPEKIAEPSPPIEEDEAE
jgi:hypothetical protein